MNKTRLEQELIRDEGLKLVQYFCPERYPTIGVGHKLSHIKNDPEAWPKEIELRQAGQYLTEDIADAMKTVERIFPAWEEWPEARQHALVNMAFNLGERKLMDFKLMKAAIDSRDWEQAAKEAKDSLWYRQVGSRAERIVSAIRKG